MSRKSPEANLQKLIIQHLTLLRKPGVLFLSIPNEAKRSAIMGGHLKAMGLRPGAADLLIVVRGRAHFMELKSEAGEQRATQIAFEADCVIAGAPYALCNNIGDALMTLEQWGALHPQAALNRWVA